MSSTAMELKLSEDQTKVLEENFRVSMHPDETTLTLVAAECGLSEDETRLWYRMRNAKWRKAEGLPAQEGSVLD